MSTSGDSRLLKICEAISDGQSVDWEAESSGAPLLSATLERLKQLEALGRAHRSIATSVSGDSVADSRTPPLCWGGLQILELVGQGSFGDVFRALDTRLQREVALKLRRIGFSESDASARRFLDEARSLARVRHPNVLIVHGADVHDRRVGFWTDFIRGKTLAARLAEEGPLGPEEATLIGLTLCRALSAVHAAGLIHGDVKAANTMREEGGRIVLMDFGAVSWQSDPAGARQSGAPSFGTPLVLAPEVLQGEAPGPASDLYSLGVLLYQLVTGRYPVEAESLRDLLDRHDRGERSPLRDLRPDLPVDFIRLVERAIEPDAASRFRSAGEMERALLSSMGSMGSTEDRSAAGRDGTRAIDPATRRPMPRIRISRQTSLHGRDADLHRLRVLYERVKEGDGQVVLIEGEAGIGKTRLVDELTAMLDREGEDVTFLFGSYPPSGAATATGAFLSAYREHFGGERIEETVADHLAPAPLLIPSFVALLKGDSRGLESSPLTKDSLQTAFVHVTRALALTRPTIVLIDDLHFAPEEGRSLFAALALGVPGHRILLIGGARPGISEEWMAGILRQEHGSRLALARLTGNDVVRILAEALHSDRIAEDLAPAMAKRCDGNPLFLFENLRALEESRHVARDARGEWTVAVTIRDLPAPASIQHLIQSRFAALDEGDRNLLEIACCCGFEFDPALVAEAAGVRAVPALKRFALIEKRHRLIHAAERHYVFDHHQVQEALYEGLFAQLREEYHARLAMALERREHALERDPKDIGGSIAVTLSELYFQGGRGREGLRYLRRSLDHLGTLRPAATVQLIDMALGFSGLVTGRERIDLLAHRASHLVLLGRPDEEQASLQEMLVLADEIGEPLVRARARRMLGFCCSRRGRIEQARAHLEEADALARAGGDALEEARVSQALGSLFLHMGRYEEALPYYVRSIDLARQAGNRHLEAQLNGSVGMVYQGLRRFDDSQRHYQMHLEVCQEMGNRSGEALATGNLGAMLIDSERHEEALAFCQRHLELSREIGFRLGETYATENLGLLSSIFGRGAEALAYLERSLRLSREIGYRVPEAESLEHLGTTLTMLGRREEAGLEYQRCLTVSREIQNPRMEGYALIGLGAVAEQSGELLDAERHYQQAYSVWTSAQVMSDFPEVLLRLGGLFRRLGREKEARSRLGEAVVRAREFRSGKVEVLALAHLALLPSGSPDEALEQFVAREQHLPLVAKMEARFLLWKATDDRSHLETACLLLEALRDHAPEEDREALIPSVPIYRDVMAASRP